MPGIEVRAFGRLYFLFKERGWPDPLVYHPREPITAGQLRDELNLPVDGVEAVFINRRVCPFSTRLREGDRVAFIPPGIPTIHRYNLGFYEMEKTENETTP